MKNSIIKAIFDNENGGTSEAKFIFTKLDKSVASDGKLMLIFPANERIIGEDGQDLTFEFTKDVDATSTRFLNCLQILSNYLEKTEKVFLQGNVSLLVLEAALEKSTFKTKYHKTTKCCTVCEGTGNVTWIF